jgi:tetratricopeptide (TPR) repeat protein
MSQRLTPWNGIANTLKQLSVRFPGKDDFSEEAQLYYRRACLAASEERYDVAMVFVAKALELEPRHLPTRLLLAQIYDRGLHEIEAAIQAYKKVIALAGYESGDPFCTAAREALSDLVTRATAIPVEPEVPVHR